MGTAAFVKEKSFMGGKIRGGFDVPLLVALAILVIFGLVMLYSASYDYSLTRLFKPPLYLFNRQIFALAVGLILFGILANLDYHKWRQLALPAMGGTVLMLFIVLFLPQESNGVNRGLFKGSIQPSELAKLVSILYLSVWLYAKNEVLHDMSFGLLPLGVILGGLGGLIFLQPDISATLTVMILGSLMFFLAGGDMKQIGIILVVGVIAVFVVSNFTATGQDRMGSFLAGLRDPIQSKPHVQASLGAIINGGWFGTGLGLSKAKYLQLPVPPTDSIFAVIAEELGLVGAVALILLYGFIAWRGFTIARRAPDMLGTLLASGLTIWFGFEVLLNILVMVGLAPFAGNALPFISSGGSSLVTMFMAFGIISNVSRQTGGATISDDEWRSFSAVIDLRGWNRRRRVSRPRRSSRTDG